MSFFNQRCLIMQTLVEIGPPNASQGQHIRKDATEQMKNLTLARTRTQILGFSSADALPTKLRMPVGKASALEKAEDLGSSPSKCQVFHLFRCVLSSVLPLRSVGRSNFDMGLHNITTLIQNDIYE